jgi:hypothetical protein
MLLILVQDDIQNNMNVEVEDSRERKCEICTKAVCSMVQSNYYYSFSW